MQTMYGELVTTSQVQTVNAIVRKLRARKLSSSEFVLYIELPTGERLGFTSVWAALRELQEELRFQKENGYL